MTEQIASSSSDVTENGLRGARPDRDAVTGVATGQRGKRGGKGRGKRSGKGRGRQGDGAPTVPDAEFTSYYNLPVINKPVWSSLDIAGYLFLGG
ncbi:MAG: hypothetical protein DLM62_01230, partial [Pseudonocardiales bacterium]